MRIVVQRVSRSRVVVDGRVVGEIGAGALILVAVGRDDLPATSMEMAAKVAHLRIFEDEHKKMNRSLLESGRAALVVSQFTLYGDVRRGRRPGFDAAAPPEQAKTLYEEFVRALREQGVTVETGIFQAHMAVELTNEGPVTILLDSDRNF